MKAPLAVLVFFVAVDSQNVDPSLTKAVETRDMQLYCLGRNEYFSGYPTLANPASFNYLGPRAHAHCYWAMEVPSHTRVHYRIDQLEYCDRCANVYLYYFEASHFSQNHKIVDLSDRVTSVPKLGVIEPFGGGSFIRADILVKNKIQANEGVQLSFYFESATANESNEIDDENAGSKDTDATYSCGSPPLQARIVGGTDVMSHKYGFFAALAYDSNGFSSNPFCGASIIADNYILTAAHCSVTYKANQLVALVGGFNWKTQADSILRHRIAEIIVHPHYNSASQLNDIALMRLADPIHVTMSAFPVCLPIKEPDNESIATVIGWGLLKENGEQAKTLQEVDVPVMSRDDCIKNSGYAEMVGQSMFCAGFVAEGSKDSCQGDSGGPLFQSPGDKYTQIGLVSWGYKCALPNYPGVYTNIALFKTWIESICPRCQWQ